ncbi:MAG: hypothetical protein LBG19_02420, partial [Prevotellaceae bacterium]|nr:hypothetical protein [Prevotellaceae bacterium]
ASYGYKKRHGVGRGENAFANGADRIDGIESFRGLREVRPAKLRGVRERTFHSRVNERELSDSCGNKNIYLTLPGSFRKAPLKLSRTIKNIEYEINYSAILRKNIKMGCKLRCIIN